MLEQLLGTCVRWWRDALWSRGSGSWWALHRERCLHHELHTHGPQRAVGVCGHLAVRHQLVAISEVPDVVDGGSSFEVATGVMKLDFKHHILTAEENVL